MPRCRRSQLRKSDQNPVIVFTCTSQKPSPSSSLAYSPRLLLVQTSQCMLLASGCQMEVRIQEKKMRATHKQNLIANTPIRSSFALAMFAQETVATPSRTGRIQRTDEAS